MAKMDSPAMAIILSRLGKKKEKPEMEMEEDEAEGEDGSEACCEDMLAAIENKDPMALKAALLDFLDIVR